MYNARYYDGKKASATDVTLEVYASRLHIFGTREESGAQLTWMFEDIRTVTNPADGLPIRLRNAKDPAARLEINDAATWNAIYAPLKAQARIGLHISFSPLLLTGLAALALVIFLALYQGVPYMAHYLTPYLPESVRNHASQEALKVLGAPEKICPWKEKSIFFTPLFTRLTDAAGIKHRGTVQVIKNSIPNAFTLPNGDIVMTSGLLEKSTSPDMLAGVLAHEIGHVVKDDAGEALVRSMGMQAVFMLMTGQGSESLDSRVIAQLLWQNSYQRGQEREADRIAMEILRKAHIAPQPFITFFQEQAKGADLGSGTLSYLSNHPSNEERITTLKQIAAEGIWPPTSSTISAESWEALRKICQ